MTGGEFNQYSCLLSPKKRKKKKKRMTSLLAVNKTETHDNKKCIFGQGNQVNFIYENKKHTRRVDRLKKKEEDVQVIEAEIIHVSST